MRVLHVITGLRRGGAETQLLELARRTRHEVEVAALYDVGTVGDQLRDLGVPVHDLRMASSLDARAIPRLVALLRGGAFDAVHCHLFRATLYGTLAARLARTPIVVVTEHSLGESQLEGRRLTRGVRSLLRHALRRADAVIAVSPVVRSRLERLGIRSERIRTIPNGVDLERFAFDPAARAATRAALGLAPDARVVGSISRLAPTKGLDRVLHGVAALDPEVRLVIAGDGSERDSLAALAASLGLASRVLLLGERSDTPALLSAFDVFVSASDPGAETFAVAPLEALANGLPVVVTTCPGLDGVEDRRVVRTAPEARRIGADLATALAVAPDRTTAPRPLLAGCAVERVVAEIDDLYPEIRSVGTGRRRSTTGA